VTISVSQARAGIEQGSARYRSLPNASPYSIITDWDNYSLFSTQFGIVWLAFHSGKEDVNADVNVISSFIVYRKVMPPASQGRRLYPGSLGG